MSQAAPDPRVRMKVMTASPEELRLLLFDAAIRFTQDAGDALAQETFDAAHALLTKAQQITLELSNSLNRKIDPDLCDKLSALYTYIYRRLVDADVERDGAALRECLELLEYERETWRLLIDKLQRVRHAARKHAAKGAAFHTKQNEDGDHGPIASIGPRSIQRKDGDERGRSAEG